MIVRRLVLVSLLSLPATAWSQTAAPPPIADNSFLIEEAYNQEAGVVQHVSTFERARGGAWAAGFTQEWPFISPRHQLSATLSYAGGAARAAGFEDAAVHYRYQLLGLNGGPVALAPRISALIPVGDEAHDRGRGAWGVEANLPLSYAVSDGLVLHGNAGLSHVPRARNALGLRAAATDGWLGGSVVWLARPTLNLLVEALWLSESEVIGTDRTARSQSTIVSPGIRGAINTAGGLQIVPGIAFPFALDDDVRLDGIFLYLSLEHAFRRSP